MTQGQFSSRIALVWIQSFSYSEIGYQTLMVRVSANGPGNWGSIPGRVIPKTQKMVLDASLLKTQHHNEWRGARDVMVIVTGYGHGDTSSILGQDWLHFT